MSHSNPQDTAPQPTVEVGVPRQSNLGLIASLVHHHGSLSRAQLTRRTGLNRSTVGTLIGQLVGLGLLYESAPTGEAQVGRPSPEVRPNPSAAALAVNPEIDAVTVGLVSLGGNVRKKIRFPTDRIPTAREAVNIAAAVIAGMRSELDSAYRIVGVGVAVPGLVNRSEGVVRHAPHLGWRDEPVAQMLAEATGYSCRAANDASLGAEAELIFGAGAGMQNLVYLNGGASGIGGGVVVGGKLLAGASGYAGELGHTFVRSEGRACHCGGSGCLETEVSQGPLLTLAATENGGDAVQFEEELRARSSRNGNVEVLRQLEYLGIALRNAVNIFNPEAIVLDGFLGILHSISPETLPRLLRMQALDGPADQVHIYRAELGSDSMMIGAAELAFAPLLADPTSSVIATPLRFASP
ncbi:ROK family transcriptional regulator [Pseudarthrobacter equi]|nr:ROK family transcriptional regulator [Pseudarthrobacter sp. C4D7]MCT9625990.1 ROK family transcriptional regulator [Pseudarthrobacter equi]NUT72157.1 ROK family transcriptional regulator [Pseudarthrobacter sp. C4D7]